MLALRARRAALAAALTFGILGGVAAALGHLETAYAQPRLAAFVVTNTNDSGPGSLREALLAANLSAGADDITIAATGTLHLLSALPVITGPLTIAGPGPELLALDGGGALRVLEATNVELALSGLTLQNGHVPAVGQDGAGLRAAGRLTLTDVHVLSSTAHGDGGGLYAGGALTLTRVLLRGNLSTNGIGGGLRAVGSGATLIDTAFISNTSAGDGGGAYALGVVTAQGGLFAGNQCTRGTCDGGGMFSFSTLAMTGTQFVSNTAHDLGGGLLAPGSVRLTGVLFQENQSTTGGGGGLSTSGPAYLTATQFLSNSAHADGGGLAAYGALTLTQGLFQNNHTVIGDGGGLYVSGAAVLDGARFSGNGAVRGGGLYHTAGAARVTNSLFAGNTAASTLGLALILDSAQGAAVVHTTVVGGPAAAGPALVVLTGSVGVTNSIIASHTVGLSLTAGSLSENYNLFFDNGLDRLGLPGGPQSAVGDPRFAAAAQGDYRLRTGSAAVDLGTDMGITVDAEGEPRPQGVGFDAGFDEADAITGLAAAHAPVSALVGAPVAFTATVTGGTGVTYSWDFADGTPPAGGSALTHTFALTGVYHVVVTALNSTGSLTATTPVAVGLPPVLLHRWRLPLVAK